MYYLFHGTDTDKVREKARVLFDSLRFKKPDASFGELDTEEVTAEKIEELVGGSGLFENKCVVLTKNIFSNTISREIAEKFINEIAESPNIFIIAETALTKALSKKLEKRSEKTLAIDSSGDKKEQKEENIFSIADAFGRRDKKLLWMKLNEAFDNGVPTEELHGIIFWQLKSMIIASKTKDATEAGLNPYVFSKSKTFAKNFKEKELEKITNELVKIYHEAHRGKLNFNIALEKLALDI